MSLHQPIPVRPFDYDHEDRELKIIGVELRVVDRRTNQQREVLMIGDLDIRLPRGNGWEASGAFNVTVHTSLGDATSITQDLPR